MTSSIKTFALLLVLAAMALPSVARADDDRGRGHDRGHNDYGHDRRHDRRDDRHDRYDRRSAYRDGYRDGYRNDRLDDRRYSNDGYRGDYGYRAPRVVYQPAPRNYYWQRGSRYNDRGYGPTYIVSDYRPYGLRAPPRGYGWRRSDAGDFLLVAAATGIITDLVLHGGR